MCLIYLTLSNLTESSTYYMGMSTQPGHPPIRRGSQAGLGYGLSTSTTGPDLATGNSE